MLIHSIVNKLWFSIHSIRIKFAQDASAQQFLVWFTKCLPNNKHAVIVSRLNKQHSAILDANDTLDMCLAVAFG